MKRKVKIDGDTFYMIANELKRHVSGFRGLSSKKKRIHEKNVKKVIPIILEVYLKHIKVKELERFIEDNVG